MSSNEYHSPQEPRGPGGDPKPAGADEVLCSERIQVERKTFIFTLKENPRGRFLRITEDVGGRRDTIIIPATGLEDFKRVIGLMLEAQNSAPSKNSPSMFED